MPTLHAPPHSPMRIDSPLRTSSLSQAGSCPVYSFNRSVASLPLAESRSEVFMDIDVPLPRAPARLKRKADDIDGSLQSSIRRRPAHDQDCKRRRLAQPMVMRQRKRRVSKIAKARNMFLKRTQGVVRVTQPDPNAYPFCYPDAYPTDLRVLQQVAPHHFSPRAVHPFVPAPDAPMSQAALASKPSQLDVPMAAPSMQCIADSSQPVGLGFITSRMTNAQRIAHRAHKRHRAHLKAKSRAAIDKLVKQGLPRSIRKATQTTKVPRKLTDVRKATTPYLGSFEWKRCRAYHPVLRVAPLDIPIDLEERLEIVVVRLDRLEGDVDMEYEEPTSYDTTDDDEEVMEIYFTPLPSYDMLSSAFDDAMDIVPSEAPVAQVVPVVQQVTAQSAETATEALPDYEEEQQPTQADSLHAVLQVKAPAPAAETSDYFEDDDEDEEDEEVWFDASEEAASEAALITKAENFLATIGAELDAAQAAAETEELFEELFGPEPTAPSASDEDVFGSSTVPKFVQGSSSRRTMRYRPVPGVSFDD
ncbi:hypothetical protein L227DRAFT_651655 [Lentinus tigrinus ALCF2SS1-6]|uniref:Uncharacterized protein n=1 Tax=Lentinus tigrinus ALCF2SS1-6 TaxID=1328759 RepID=A0A5C2SG94_9APHY|nr:hypothetical protein L227DRAFT_651655 [Lentinus tigrinus ALCF2SS1-6]